MIHDNLINIINETIHQHPGIFKNILNFTINTWTITTTIWYENDQTYFDFSQFLTKNGKFPTVKEIQVIYI